MNYIKRNIFNKKSLIGKMILNYSSLSQLERSFMYVPGDKLKMIDKVSAFSASQAPDIMVLDCEDGVAYDNKNLARKNIFKSLESGVFNKVTQSTVCIRANAVSAPLLSVEDILLICESLKATNYRFPQMVNLPKVENFADVLWFDEQISSNVDIGKLAQPLLLSMMIESCSSVINLRKLLKHVTTRTLSCLRLSNIVFGSDDYCASLGVARSRSNDEVLYARQHVANVAVAFKVSAIDMVDIDLNDMDYYKQNCKFGAGIGFVGKQVIHPKQIDIVHAAFSPASEKVDWASELIKEYEKNKQEKQGVFVFRNQMIDMPTILQAQGIMKMSHLIKNRC